MSHTGGVRWKYIEIDACIADIVQALQVAGIDMRSSCCGHNGWGEIILQDGRILMIQPYPAPKDEIKPKLRGKLFKILTRRT